MARYIKRIQAEGVLGRFDIDQEFQEGVNVLFGRNGTGKTTLLHILANVLNGDYKRFAFLEFRKIRVFLDDETTIKISNKIKKRDNLIDIYLNNETIINSFSKQDILKEFAREERLVTASSYRERILQRIRDSEDIKPLLPVAYFPAFRTMIEAWASADRVEYRARSSQDVQYLSTNLARELFGSFVPNVSYPSPLEIERELSDEIERALVRIARADREYFGELLPRVFQALSKNSTFPDLIEGGSSDAILEEIKTLVKKLEDYPLKAAPTIALLQSSVSSFEVDDQSKRLAERVLNIYREALREVVSVQENSFKSIETYLSSINSFLEGKNIEICLGESSLSGNRREPIAVGIKFEKGISKIIPGIRYALSSGERQIVTLIYAATHMSKQEIVLIDEPEISLHVDWQRHLLKKMSEQLGERQIIACTHSPVIGADYEDRVIIFEPKITRSPETIDNHELVEEDIEVF